MRLGSLTLSSDLSATDSEGAYSKGRGMPWNAEWCHLKDWQSRGDIYTKMGSLPFEFLPHLTCVFPSLATYIHI